MKKKTVYHIIINLFKVPYNFKSFFHKNSNIILEVTFFFLVLVFSSFLIVLIDPIFDLVNSIFVIFKKLHSGDLLCEILGLNEDQTEKKERKFYLRPFRYGNFKVFFELLSRHLFWLRGTYRYTLSGPQKETFGIFPSYSNSIRTMQSDQNTVVWGNDSEEFQDLSLGKNWIFVNSWYRMTKSSKGRTVIFREHQHPILKYVFVPRMSFLFPNLPINSFIKNEILYRNPNYSDTEPGYLYWPRIRSKNQAAFYDLSRTRWSDKTNSGTSHKSIGAVVWNKSEEDLSKSLKNKQLDNRIFTVFTSRDEMGEDIKSEFVHNFPIMAKTQNQHWNYFPHYKYLISNGNMAVNYIYWKNKKFFPKNWNSGSDSFWFSTYLDSAENKVFTQNFPYIKGTNWRRDLQYPARYSALELYKFYALDEDMFSLIHNYYKEIIRPFNLSSSHFTFVQEHKAWQKIYFSRLNIDKMQLTQFKDRLDTTIKPESNEFKNIYVTNFINSNIYTNVYFTEFSKELIDDVQYATLITDVYQDISIQLRPEHYRSRNKLFNMANLIHRQYTRYWYFRFKRYIFWNYRRKPDFRRYHWYKTIIKNDYKPLDYKSLTYNHAIQMRRTTTTHIMYPRSRGNLIFFAIRDIIFGIPKEKLYYEIDPSILGISGLIELSLTLKKLKKSIKNNKDYYFLIDSHFDEYQLKWMFLYNDLINKKLQSSNDQDFLSYFRKRRRRIRISIRHKLWRAVWYTQHRYPHEIQYRATSLSFGNTKRFKRRRYLKFSRWIKNFKYPTVELQRKKARVRKTWLTIYPYDYSSNKLFAFLENPAKQKDRQAFIRAINAYYYSLKAFIRGCWKIKMGRIAFFRHTGDLKFFYNRTRVVEFGTKGYERIMNLALRNNLLQVAKGPQYLYERHSYFRHITDAIFKGLIVYESSIELRNKNRTPDTRTGLWGSSRLYRKKKLRLWKFYRDLSLIINSRRDLPFYGLGVQHLFTRISRELFIINMPKYRDFYFNEYAFRFMTIKKSKRQLIVDYLNNFNDEEINKVWPEFDIEIINHYLTLENVNFFFSFLRKLFFNRVYNHLNTKWNYSTNYMAFRPWSSRFDFENSDRKQFNKIWLQYKEILIDTLFINKLYNMKWNTMLHTQKEVVEYQISKHIGNLENHFLQVLFDKDFKKLNLRAPSGFLGFFTLFKIHYAEDFATTRVHFLSDPRILFLDMSKYNFHLYLDYFKTHLLKYEKTSRDYKIFFRAMCCANKDYVQTNFQKPLYFSSFKFGKKDYLLNGFTVFRKIYRTFQEVLRDIKING